MRPQLCRGLEAAEAANVLPSPKGGHRPAAVADRDDGSSGRSGRGLFVCPVVSYTRIRSSENKKIATTYRHWNKRMQKASFLRATLRTLRQCWKAHGADVWKSALGALIGA